MLTVFCLIVLCLLCLFAHALNRSGFWLLNLFAKSCQGKLYSSHFTCEHADVFISGVSGRTFTWESNTWRGDGDTSCLIKLVFGEQVFTPWQMFTYCLWRPHWLFVSQKIFYTYNILTHFHEFQALAGNRSRVCSHVLEFLSCNIIYFDDFPSVHLQQSSPLRVRATSWMSGERVNFVCKNVPQLRLLRWDLFIWVSASVRWPIIQEVKCGQQVMTI